MTKKGLSEREVSDGWTTWLACGPACDLQVVRPGSVQCNYTDAACPNACASETAKAPSLIEDVVKFRQEYVHAYIDQRVTRCEGDFTEEDCDRWEAIAHVRWREKYPAFTALLPSPLPVIPPGREFGQ